MDRFALQWGVQPARWWIGCMGPCATDQDGRPLAAQSLAVQAVDDGRCKQRQGQRGRMVRDAGRADPLYRCVDWPFSLITSFPISDDGRFLPQADNRMFCARVTVSVTLQASTFALGL